MSKKSFQFTIEPWSVVRENKEYPTPIFNLLQRKMRLEAKDEKNEGNFYVLEAPEWVNAIPITKDNEVLLVEQYRYGIEQPTLEIPGGMVDPGEEPMESIKRELIEETGYHSANWSSLGKVSANPAIMTNYTHLYLAEDCKLIASEKPEGDKHERINVHLLSMDEFLDFVADGTIHHSIMVAAVARFLLKSRREM
ncbi:NUDIX domain-containing protein [Aliifodinibius salipaludis]|uniref:GDP-mannose pyrophosphatase n=1 Tax=Fodinibius salipaludis TaxID=2032627 RepID=A0A2A2GDC7_9BACT|nr:NUDIX hydrolase [Aliifodinibius salipaludis]PAU94855.1 NUDIX domain-containing protein [Aliifodinibius salipaludis]